MSRPFLMAGHSAYQNWSMSIADDSCGQAGPRLLWSAGVLRAAEQLAEPQLCITAAAVLLTHRHGRLLAMTTTARMGHPQPLEGGNPLLKR